MVGASVTSALGSTNAHLQQIDANVEALREVSERDLAVIQARLDALEVRASRIELEEQASRQQLDEAVDFLRVQHFAVREALDLRCSGGTADPTVEPGATSGD